MPQPLSDEQLVELAQSKSPDELLPSELEAIRARLTESFDLQRVFIEQLQMEEFLHALLGEVTISSEVIFAIADQTESRSGFGFRGWLIGLGLVLLLGLFGYRVHQRFFKAEQADGQNGTPTHVASTEDDASNDNSGDEAFAQDSPNAGDVDATEADADIDSSSDGQNRPGEITDTPPNVPDDPPDEPWQELASDRVWSVDEAVFPPPSELGDARSLSREELSAWLERPPGLPFKIEETRRQNRPFAGMDGWAKLRAPWQADAVLRLGVFDARGFAIHVYAGERGVTLRFYERPRPRVWAAFAISRTGDDPKPQIEQLLTTDDARHARLNFSTIEVRHQQDELVLSCGDVRLMTVPFEQSPDELYFEGRAWFSEFAMYRGEPIPDTADVEFATVEAGRLDWTTVSTTETVHVAAEDDGSILFEALGADEARRAFYSLERSGPCDIVWQFDSAEIGTGFYMGDEHGQPLFRLGFVRDRRSGRVVFDLLSPNDVRTEGDYDPNYWPVSFVGKRQWLRMVVARGVCKIYVSGDGKHWGRARREPFRQRLGSVSTIGLFAQPGDQSRSIRVRSLGVRRFSALESIASPEALAELDSIESLPVGEFPAWLAETVTTRPTELALSDWRRSRAIHTLCQVTDCPFERALWEGVIHDLIGMSERSAAERLRCLDEMAFLNDQWSGGDAHRMVEHYLALGRRLIDEEADDPAESVLRALVRAPIWSGTEWSALNEGFIRDALAHSLYGGEWSKAWGLCRRVRHMVSSTHPDRGWDRWNGASRAYFEWAEAVALRHLPTDAVSMRPISAGRWRAPLMLELSKDGYNVMAEFESALRGQSWEDACRIIQATDSFDRFGLLPDAADPQLWVSLPRAIALAMRDHPLLQEAMREKFGRTGLVRVREAIARGDSAAVESATVRLYGTEAAAEAHRWLGDQSLAIGQFAQAADHYRRALNHGDDSLATSLTARRRLARSLLGRSDDEASDDVVEFGTHILSRPEFDLLLDDLSTAKQSGAIPSTETEAHSEDSIAPAPSRFQIVKHGRVDGDFGRNETRAARAGTDWLARQMALAVYQDRLYVSNRFQVKAFDLTNIKPVWSRSLGDEQGEATGWPFVRMQPLIAGDHLYVRRLTNRGPELACLNSQTGELNWQNRPDNHVASDPVLVRGHLLAVLATFPRSGTAHFDLVEFQRETGEVIAQRPIARLRDRWGRQLPCQLAYADGLLFAQLGGVVACLDLHGQVHWLRTVPVVPREAEPTWQFHEDNPLLVEDSRVIFAPSESRVISCVESATGRSVWSRPTPNLRRVLGVVADQLVYQTDEGFVALHVETGEFTWRHSATQIQHASICGNRAMIYSQLVEYRQKECHPALVWLDAKTGEVTATSTLRDWTVTPEFSMGPMMIANERLITLAAEDRQTVRPEICEWVPLEQPAGGPIFQPDWDGWRMQSEAIDKSRMNMADVLPGWTILSSQVFPGRFRFKGVQFQPEFRSETDLAIVRATSERPVHFARKLSVPESGGELRLRFAIENDAPATISVIVNDSEVASVSAHESARTDWQSESVELAPYAGQTVWIAVVQTVPEGDKAAEIYWKQLEYVP